MYLGLWLDIAVRLSALMLAAWIGARWLAQPVRQLADAARELGRDIHRPPLVEQGSDECREATRVFNQMQAQICQQLNERDSFVAAVSHDLRTPLTRMALRAESLQDAKQRLSFQRDITEMNTMITATLDHLRGVALGEPMVLLDVGSLLSSLADDYLDWGHPVTLVEPDPSSPMAPLLTQAQALRRCISNLLDNAVRYGGSARVRCFDEADQLCIEVSDPGPGMSAADLDRALTPFFRAEGSRNRHSGGVGLGLSIANDIARRLRGEVRLKNGSNGGLVATVLLPRQSAPT
jgi:protein-histidine pros-kinase